MDEEEWSSEPSDDDDPVWRALYDQLPPWMRNPENPEGELEAVWNAHRSPVVKMKDITIALEKTIKAKTKQVMLQKRGGMPHINLGNQQMKPQQIKHFDQQMKHLQ